MGGFPLLLHGQPPGTPPPPGGAGAPRFIIEAAFGSLPDDPTYNWTTIHDTATGGYVRALSFSRGRNNQLNRIDAGTGTLVLNNVAREWDPQNTNSPFYPNVRPMLPIRGSVTLGGATTLLFLHYADGFPRKRHGPNYSEVAVSTVDGQEGLALARIPPVKATLAVNLSGVNNELVFTAKQPGPDGNNITIMFVKTHFRPLRKQRVVITVTGKNIRVDYIDGSVQVDEVLAALRADAATMRLVDVDNATGSDGSGDMHDLPETHLAGGDTVTFPEEAGGARISRCLDLADWPTDLRSVSTGADRHGQLAFSTTEDGKLLSHMQDIASLGGENGLLYVNGSGKMVFLDRVDKLTGAHAVPQAVFSDIPDPGEYAYVDAVPNETKDLVVNDALANRAGGVTQTAYDPDSVAAYRRRSQSFTTTLATDLDVLAAVQAAVVEMKDPLERIEQVTVMPGADPAFWQVLLGLEIGSRVTVKEHLPATGAGYGFGEGPFGEGPFGGGSGGDVVNSSDYIIQGLSWQAAGSLNATRVTYNVWPADPISNWFILDDPVRGVLDAGNRLGR